MKYHIKNITGKIIASFENEDDRDICLGAFNEYDGENCQFKPFDS